MSEVIESITKSTEEPKSHAPAKEIEQLENFNFKVRTGLPFTIVDRSKGSIYSILKQCVDRELYKFTLPIIWNEPLSLTQRMTENLRYSGDLLDKASKSTNPIDRLKYIGAFLVSSTSAHVQRLSKPFNPLLGETYEFNDPEKGYRVLCEQVSHHPPVTASYCESIRPSKMENKVRWKYYGSINPFMKINFLHACIDVYPEGIQTIELPEWDEIYTWQNLKVTAHNIVMGKMWIEYIGRVEIVNHKLKLKCVMDFKPYSWFSKAYNRFDGYISDDKDKKVALLNGKWDEFIYSTNSVEHATEFFKRTEALNTKNSSSKIKKSSSNSSLKESDIELLWQTLDTEGSLHPEYYNFSNHTFCLNELYPELEKSCAITLKSGDLSKTVTLGPIASTDSRLRPDLRSFENGECDFAAAEKHRLEEKQREKRNKNPSFQDDWRPLWFDKGMHALVKNEETYHFNDKYWDRDFSQCPDIY